MKSLIITLIALGSVSAFARDAGEEFFKQKFVASCKLELDGSDGSKIVRKASAPGQIIASPGVSFELGDYSLGVTTSYEGEPEEQRPYLEMVLYHNDKNPFSEYTNLALVTGLKGMKVGQSGSVNSRGWLDIAYKGKKYTTINYTCTITRVR